MTDVVEQAGVGERRDMCVESEKRKHRQCAQAMSLDSGNGNGCRGRDPGIHFGVFRSS